MGAGEVEGEEKAKKIAWKGAEQNQEDPEEISQLGCMTLIFISAGCLLLMLFPLALSYMASPYVMSKSTETYVSN